MDAPDTNPAERRGAQRFDTAMPLDVGGVKAKMTDLSTTGVGFVAEQPVEPGTSVAIGIRHLPDDEHPPAREAEIVRVTPADGGYVVGAKLK